MVLSKNSSPLLNTILTCVLSVFGIVLSNQTNIFWRNGSLHIHPTFPFSENLTSPFFLFEKAYKNKETKTEFDASKLIIGLLNKQGADMTKEQLDAIQVALDNAKSM